MTNKALLVKIAAELIRWSKETEITYDTLQVFCNSLALKDSYHTSEIWRALENIKTVIDENE